MNSNMYQKSVYFVAQGGIEYRYLFRVDGRGHITQLRLTLEEYNYFSQLSSKFVANSIFNQEAAKFWKEAVNIRMPEDTIFPGILAAMRNEKAMEEDGIR